MKKLKEPVKKVSWTAVHTEVFDKKNHKNPVERNSEIHQVLK